MANNKVFQLPFPCFKVTFNYDLTVEQLNKDGKFDWVNEDITSVHFPSSEKGMVQAVVYLVHFNRYIGSEEALKVLNILGLRSISLKELEGLGSLQNLQRDYPIAALGSTWRSSTGILTAPCLNGDVSYHRLDLIGLDGDFHSRWRFAAVPK